MPKKKAITSKKSKRSKPTIAAPAYDDQVELASDDQVETAGDDQVETAGDDQVETAGDDRGDPQARPGPDFYVRYLADRAKRRAAALAERNARKSR